MPGHGSDTVGVLPLIDGLGFGTLIAEKAFDSDALFANLNGLSAGFGDAFWLTNKTRRREVARKKEANDDGA